MASVTGVWWREKRAFMGWYPTSGDADTAIKRVVQRNGGRTKEDGAQMTLDKISLNV